MPPRVDGIEGWWLMMRMGSIIEKYKMLSVIRSHKMISHWDIYLDTYIHRYVHQRTLSIRILKLHWIRERTPIDIYPTLISLRSNAHARFSILTMYVCNKTPVKNYICTAYTSIHKYNTYIYSPFDLKEWKPRQMCVCCNHRLSQSVV